LGSGPTGQDIWALRESAGFLPRGSSGPFQLTNGPLSFSFPKPSPEGKKLFVQGSQPRAELVRYDPQSGQFVSFLAGISAGDLDFSRDSRWVAYISYPDYTLWRSRLDGSDRLQLTYAPVWAALPRWSPDGKEIAY